jgi:hypothetical protein
MNNSSSASVTAPHYATPSRNRVIKQSIDHFHSKKGAGPTANMSPRIQDGLELDALSFDELSLLPSPSASSSLSHFPLIPLVTCFSPAAWTPPNKFTPRSDQDLLWRPDILPRDISSSPRSNFAWYVVNKGISVGIFKTWYIHKLLYTLVVLNIHAGMI